MCVAAHRLRNTALHMYTYICSMRSEWTKRYLELLRTGVAVQSTFYLQTLWLECSFEHPSRYEGHPLRPDDHWPEMFTTIFLVYDHTYNCFLQSSQMHLSSVSVTFSTSYKTGPDLFPQVRFNSMWIRYVFMKLPILMSVRVSRIRWLFVHTRYTLSLSSRIRDPIRVFFQLCIKW